MKGILLPAIIETVASRKDSTIKIVLGTQELSPARAGEVLSLMNKLATVYISNAEIDPKEIDQVDKINPDLPGKTKSQRLRGVLFKLFEQGNEGFKSFDEYYSHHMERIIDHLKNKIEN